MIEFRGISKSFGPIYANEAVNFHVAKGSIHAIVGENGAGKSTAMKILYGQYLPNGGELFLRGAPASWSSPRDAIEAGIGMVHQHFMLAGAHSVLENILLGTGARFWKPYRRSRMREKILKLSELYGLRVDPDARVDSLPVGIRQRVEILKLLLARAEILILDEPTAVLTPQEIHSLFQNLRRLQGEGKTILLITHKLKEVMEIADHVTVFRAGRVVASMPRNTTNISSLAEHMVGQKIELGKPWPVPCTPKETILEAKNLGGQLKNLSFSLRSGEIVGIAGVEGNGQSELLRALLFPRKNLAGGRLRLFGQDISEAETGEIRSLGVGVLAEDRLRDSLLLDSDLKENFLLGHHGDPELQNRGVFRDQTICAAALQMMKEYDVRPRLLSARARSLSGGNQQKFVVGRELFRNPRFLIAAHPTRGVDVGAQEFIHKRIFESRDTGAAILLISSELDEIMRLSDRVFVMYAGAIVAEYSRGEASEAALGLAMGGGQRSA